jgi:hypothetical protein
MFTVEVILYFETYKHFYQCAPQFLSILDKISDKRSAYNAVRRTQGADFFRIPGHFSASSYIYIR